MAPYQRQVKRFAEELVLDVLGVEATVTFDPVDVRNDKEMRT